MPTISRQRLFRFYVPAVTAAGLALILLSALQSDWSTLLGDYPYVFGAFTALLLLTELRPMRYDADGGVVTASWTFAFTLLFIAPLASAILAAGLCAFTADLIRSRSLSRTAFNTAQFALSLYAGALIGSQIYDLLSVANGQPLNAGWLIAAAAAWAVSFLLNGIIISIVIALHQAMPVSEILVRSLRVNLGMDGVLLALSPVFLLAAIEAPIVVPLLLGTVFLIFRSATVALSNRHEATHDQLTNIPNRRFFEDHTTLMLSSADRSAHLTALIHIDLDGFKGINDRLGHHYGDEVLKEVAARLQRSKRPVDFVARLGGDEFVVTLGSLTDRDEAEQLARDIWNDLRQPMDIEGIPLAVGASLGVAIYPRDGEDLHTLLNNADIAMYSAKSAAQGVQLYATGSSNDGPSRVQLLTELRHGIEDNQLELHYQPKIDIPSGQITGVEALVRWNHPEHGLIQPSWFIPQAEQTELMTPLTDKVIEMAAVQCRKWLVDGNRLTVSVNTSARNLHDLKFPGRVAETLERVGLQPELLELEITENTVMADPVRASAVIAQLRAIGISLAIDDFGTGYSSLTSLQSLTIDRIKIDRSFIANLSDGVDELAIVRSVIDLGKALGLIVVAEGIETQAVYDIVRSMGCDEFQGYLASKPVPASEIAPLIAQRLSFAPTSHLSVAST